MVTLNHLVMLLRAPGTVPWVKNSYCGVLCAPALFLALENPLQQAATHRTLSEGCGSSAFNDNIFETEG